MPQACPDEYPAFLSSQGNPQGNSLSIDTTEHSASTQPNQRQSLPRIQTHVVVFVTDEDLCG